MNYTIVYNLLRNLGWLHGPAEQSAQAWVRRYNGLATSPEQNEAIANVEAELRR